MRRGSVAVAVGLLVVAQAVAQTAAGPGPVVVTLQTEVTVNEPVVSLEAVATIQGGTATLRKRLAELDVAEVSKVGHTVAVGRDQVAFRIQLAGIDPHNFRVEGPAQVLVKMTAVELTETEVVKTAQRAVLARLPGEHKDVEFRLQEAVRLPALGLTTQDQLHLAADPGPVLNGSGKVRVDVAIFVNGQRRAAAPVLLDVVAYRQAAVATRRIDAGDLVQASVLRLERRVFHAGDQWLPYSEQLLGKRVQRTIPPGQILLNGDVDVPAAADEYLIRARDSVKLLARVGSLQVTVLGEALQDGRVGDMIRVRNIDSSKVVVGRVVARATVEVDY